MHGGASAVAPPRSTQPSHSNPLAADFQANLAPRLAKTDSVYVSPLLFRVLIRRKKHLFKALVTPANLLARVGIMRILG